MADQERNRMVQAEAAAERDRIRDEAQQSDLTQWQRVSDLVSKEASLSSDTDRMHRLLINLKFHGLKQV
jgi:hypothetical protein